MHVFSSVRGGAQLSNRLVEEGLMHVTSWGGGMDSDWVVREVGGFNRVLEQIWLVLVLL